MGSRLLSSCTPIGPFQALDVLKMPNQHQEVMDFLCLFVLHVHDKAFAKKVHHFRLCAALWAASPSPRRIEQQNGKAPYVSLTTPFFHPTQHKYRRVPIRSYCSRLRRAFCVPGGHWAERAPEAPTPTQSSVGVEGDFLAFDVH